MSTDQFNKLASEVKSILDQNDAILRARMADLELDTAMDLAREAKHKADTVKTVVVAMRLALNELEVLRPIGFGRDDVLGERDPVKVDAEFFVKESLVMMRQTIDALEKDWRKFTDEHENACAKVRELDPIGTT